MKHLYNIEQLTAEILDILDARSKDVIMRRYGLKGDVRETLESIGREYGITRERVRQIESQTKKTLGQLRDRMMPMAELLERIFAEHGGVLTEDHVIKLALGKAEGSSNSVHFYLQILPEYTYISHNQRFHPHWRHQEHAHENTSEILECACEILDETSRPVAETELIQAVKTKLAPRANLPDQFIFAALVASKDLDRTVFEAWGRITWAEVNPRGVGDKAYAVLRRQSKPAHFREITDMINEAGFDQKRANPQTVHNELIKDERFVLVGRGLYGLTEWGYKPGTVADVLESILKEAGKALSRDELVERVLQQRLVKKNTILLGLQNNLRFQKVERGRYALR